MAKIKGRELQTQRQHMMYYRRRNRNPQHKTSPPPSKHWEILEGACLNEGFLYGGMTCPPRLGFLKYSLIRKELGLQGSKANPHYYKSPNTLSHQGTHNLPFSSTLEL